MRERDSTNPVTFSFDGWVHDRFGTARMLQAEALAGYTHFCSRRFKNQRITVTDQQVIDICGFVPGDSVLIKESRTAFLHCDEC